jgi:hypothetical protein
LSKSTEGESTRDQAIRRVMRSISRRVVNAGPLPVQAKDGSYPVVVALPDDTVADMEERRNRIGRDVNIVVAYPERMVLIAMRDAVREDPAEIHPDSTMDMLVFYVRNHSEDSPAIRVGSKTAPRIEELAYAF